MTRAPGLAACAFAAFAFAPAQAQTPLTGRMAAPAWPAKPARVLVGFAPGGPNDMVVA